jgi:hypothetical protein
VQYTDSEKKRKPPLTPQVSLAIVLDMSNTETKFFCRIDAARMLETRKERARALDSVHTDMLNVVPEGSPVWESLEDAMDENRSW